MFVDTPNFDLFINLLNNIFVSILFETFYIFNKKTLHTLMLKLFSEKDPMKKPKMS